MHKHRLSYSSRNMVFARPLAKAPEQPVDVDAALDMSVSATSDPAPACGSQRKGARKSGRDRQTLCRGAPDLPCCYAADGSAEPGRGKHDGRCIFCNPTAMVQTLETEWGRGNVVRLLKRWRKCVCSSAPLQNVLASQEEALSWRQSVAAELDAAQSQQYRVKVEEDRAYVQRKFFAKRSPDQARKLPVAKSHVSGLAEADLRPRLQRHRPTKLLRPPNCKQHSWKVCALCGSVQPQHLKEADLREKAPTALAKCKNCSKPEAAQIWVPSVEEVPGPLRGLSRPMLLALRMLDIDCGPGPAWKADLRSEVWRHLVQLKTSFFGGHRGDGNKIRVNFVARLEFQVVAVVPPEGDPLRGYVLGGRAGRTRCYSPEVMDVLKCHQDVQARAVYLPPRRREMWLLMASQAFVMFFLGGTVQPIIAPHPGMPVMPEYVRRYEAAAWRGEMTLLEFLRKVNVKGAILNHIRRSHASARSELTLEEYALRYETFGEKVVAAEMVSMMNDKFFGQWLALHVPFRQLDDLLVPEIVDQVPDNVKYFACALYWAPDLWRRPPAIRADVELRAHREAFIEMVISMISAQDGFVQQHLDSKLVRPEHVPDTNPLMAYAEEEDSLQFTALGWNTTSTLALTKHPEFARSKMMRSMGPEIENETAASSCVELDTCHGAFLFHRALTESLALMTGYHLIVIDEAFQLVEEHFEGLHQMWLAAGRVPCLVLAGDEWQLPPPDRMQRSLAHHPEWKFVYKVELHHVWRQDNGDPLLGKLMLGVAITNPPRLLQHTDNDTTVITCTRRGAALLCLEVLRIQPAVPLLGRVLADYECNPVNYDETGKLLEQLPGPLDLPLYAGLRLRLTRNVDKPNDFVNGMSTVVLSFDHHKQAILVETETRQRLCVYPITTDEVLGGRLTYYPVKPGFADTPSTSTKVPSCVTSPSGRTGLDARPPAMWLCRVCEKTWTICWAGVSKRSTSFQLAEKMSLWYMSTLWCTKPVSVHAQRRAHFLGIM
ncbi:unnamed protein product [Symbiodinium microadriaticum]|nr:unnamed protein product [Symbiodinium microadriaticum]CAE7306664.1 unnamed protein product [Symbiodinium sp. KB8]